MKKKLCLFILLTLLCSNNCVQCMDLTSSLQTLNIKLQQLTKQLKPITEISVGVNKIFNELQSNIETMQNSVTTLDKQLKLFFEIKFENMKVDFLYGDPLNNIAEQAQSRAIKAKQLYKILENSSGKFFDNLKLVGDFFKKGFSGQQKRKFLTILEKVSEQKNKIHNIFNIIQQKIKLQNLSIEQKKEEVGRPFLNPELSVQFFLDTVTSNINFVYSLLNFSVPILQAYVKIGDKQLINNHLQSIHQHQNDLQKLHDEVIKKFDKVEQIPLPSTSHTISENEKAIIKAFEGAIKAIYQPYLTLWYDLRSVQIYSTFISDQQLKNSLSATVEKKAYNYQKWINEWDEKKEKLTSMGHPIILRVGQPINNIQTLLSNILDYSNNIVQQLKE